MITVVQAAFYGGDKAIRKIVNQPLFDGIEYKLYTNRPEVTEGTNWEPIYTVADNPRLKAREIKLNVDKFLPDSEYWFWIDANMKININPIELIQKYLNRFDICLMPHPERNNWIEEATFLVNRDQSLRVSLERAIGKYKSDGFAATSLYETGVLLRRNNERIKEFNSIWMNEVYYTCIRDQISFPYAAWKAGLAVNTFPGTNSVNQLRYKNKPYLPQWDEVTRAWN